MIEMLVIAFLVCILDKTGFMVTSDIEDIIYVKENGEQSSVPPREKVLEPEETPTEEPVEKKQNKKVTTPSPVKETVVQEMPKSEVITEEAFELEIDSIAAFASEFLTDTYDGG